MNKRRLGNSDIFAGEVGLGCWQLGADWGEAVSEQQARAILEAAHENGVSLFDTADVYGNGRSESIIGDFLKSLDGTKAPTVITKFGRGGDVYPDGYTKDRMRGAIEASLARLGVDQLALLQLHCIPTEVLRKGDVFDWLREFQAEGLIAHFGASVETIEEGLIAIKEDGLLSLQIIFNLLRQKPATELLPHAAARNIGIIVRLPLASGVLAGAYRKDKVFPASDHRHFNKDGEMFNVGETFAGIPFARATEITERMRPLCPEGYSMAEMAMRWILDHKSVSCVIPGASHPDQIRRNVAASAKGALAAETHEELRTFYETDIKHYIRGVV